MNDWRIKIANARQRASDHNTLDCLEELERLLAQPAPLLEACKCKDPAVLSNTVSNSNVPSNKISNAKSNTPAGFDKAAYQREYMRLRRAAKKEH